MTLKTRNFIVYASTALVVFSAIAYVSMFFVIDLGNPKVVELVAGIQAGYLGFSWDQYNGNPILTLIHPGFAILLSAVLCFVFLRSFRRIPSPQFFFIMLFAITEVPSLIQVLGMYGWQELFPLDAQVFFSRLLYFSRILSSMLLFVASFYASGVKLQRAGTILFSTTAIAFALAGLVPIDSSVIDQSMLLRVAPGYGADFFRISCAVLAILNLLRQAIVSREKRDLAMLFPFLALIVGKELLIAIPGVVALALAGLLWIGAVLFLLRRFTNSYLWY